MSDPTVAVMMLGVFIVLIMLGFPIAFTLMALGVGFGYYAYFDPARMDSLIDNNVFNVIGPGLMFAKVMLISFFIFSAALNSWGHSLSFPAALAASTAFSAAGNSLG